MKLTIKKGKSLTEKQIRKWNKTRIEDWHENKPLPIKNRKKYSEDVFFILYDKNNEVLSSGRIRPIQIKFMGSKYNIFGSADLISEAKGKGYGKKVKKAQIKYTKNKGITMVGFCATRNIKFYEKCGLKIGKNMAKRFVYSNLKAYEDTDPNCIYVGGKDKLMEEIIKNPKEKIKIPISRW